MAQEFVIKSDAIETKINQLLPSQGGFQPGVDFSASTMVIPVVDVTESAEGSVLRQDLQTAYSHGSITEFNVENSTSTIINTTGYWQVLLNSQIMTGAPSQQNEVIINDGTTDKIVFNHHSPQNNVNGNSTVAQEFVVKLGAGDSLNVKSSSTSGVLAGCVRQIADINGNLVNP